MRRWPNEPAEVENPNLMARSLTLPGLLALSALFAATPAAAQFGSIFSQQPPTPPADVPNGQPQQQAEPPSNYPGNQPYYSGSRRYYPNSREQADVPPAQPQPAPMALPPDKRPGANDIQEQPLPPPPGTEPKQANEPPATPQNNNKAVRTLLGLPPGQRQPRGVPQPQEGQPQQPAKAVPPPAPSGAPDTRTVVEQPPPERINNPTAVFEGLDKITGRTTQFKVTINETVQFGALQVTPKVCYSRPPTETPQTDAFVLVDEVTLKGKTRRIFTGWMFAASPGLNAVDHPIYDVWLTDCVGGKEPSLAEAPAENGSVAQSAPKAQQAAPHLRQGQ